MGRQTNQRRCRRNDLLKAARRCSSYADQRISLQCAIVQAIVMRGPSASLPPLPLRCLLPAGRLMPAPLSAAIHSCLLSLRHENLRSRL